MGIEPISQLWQSRMLPLAPLDHNVSEDRTRDSALEAPHVTTNTITSIVYKIQSMYIIFDPTTSIALVLRG